MTFSVVPEKRGQQMKKLRSIAVGLGIGALLTAGLAFGVVEAPATGSTYDLLAADAAGYRTPSPSAFASAGAKFRVPTVQCPPPYAPVTEFGSFTQTDYGYWTAAVVAICSATGPSYEVQVGSEFSYSAVKPGDLIRTRVSMSQTASHATLDDVTQAISISSSSVSPHSPVVAWDGILAANPCIFSCSGPGPVVDFGKLRIFGATIDGVTPKVAGAEAVDNLPVRTGALNVTGNAWTEMYL
jgi:hypothetical protein